MFSIKIKILRFQSLNILIIILQKLTDGMLRNKSITFVFSHFTDFLNLLVNNLDEKN